MKLHGNARTCPHSRLVAVRRVLEEGWTLATAAGAAGVSVHHTRYAGQIHQFWSLGGVTPTAGEAAAAAGAALREAFAGEAWELPRLLSEAEHANDFYFDSISQIRMQSWSSGWRWNLMAGLLSRPCFLASSQAGTISAVT